MNGILFISIRRYCTITIIKKKIYLSYKFMKQSLVLGIAMQLLHCVCVAPVLVVHVGLGHRLLQLRALASVSFQEALEVLLLLLNVLGLVVSVPGDVAPWHALEFAIAAVEHLRVNLFRTQQMAHEGLAEKNVAVHGQRHGFGCRCVLELDKCVALRTSGFFASRESQPYNIAKLREEPHHLLLVETMRDATKVNNRGGSFSLFVVQRHKMFVAKNCVLVIRVPIALGDIV